MSLDKFVTVLIPTSPIPRHPRTDLIEECIGGIRHYFPDARILIMADGVRPQIEYRRAQYEEYKKVLGDKVAAGQFGNTEIMFAPEFSQQAINTRNALKLVTTPLILFVEHDAILRPDPPINWLGAFGIVLADTANVVRLYAWGEIWHEHRYLMCGEFVREGQKFTKTRQYSQWPLLSSADYHRRILDKYFAPTQRAMIETCMYGPVCRDAWETHKIVIYGPDGAPGFTHRDGRTDEATGKRDPGEW